MFLLKIMSDQNLPDNDMTKNYKMIAIGSGDQFEFYHDEQNGLPMAQITPKEGEPYSVELTGNAYVVSETGKTVSSHWARSLWGRNELSITLSESPENAEETVRQIQQIVMETGARISGDTIIKSDKPIVIDTGKVLGPHNTVTPDASEGVKKDLDMTAEEFLRRANENDANYREPKVTYTA